MTVVGAPFLLIIMAVGLSLLRSRAFVPGCSINRIRFPGRQSFRHSTGRMTIINDDGTPRSLTGTVYECQDATAPVVTLFTREGCTLCDKVKDVLAEAKGEIPHTLKAVDITDEEHQTWFSKYKYDIPVLHIGDKFWIKHRLDKHEARLGLTTAADGTFTNREGEPDAGEMENRQAERLRQN